MNDIDKIIFDTLAAGRGINLPGIGSLSVERHAAERLPDGRIIPPHGKVVFSSSENPAYGSAALHQGYSEWLQQAACSNGVIEIKGVGVLREGIFYPSVELHERLNPQGTEPLKIKKAGQKGRMALWITIAAGAVILAVTAIICLPDRGRYAKKPATAATVNETTSTPRQATARTVIEEPESAADNIVTTANGMTTPADETPLTASANGTEATTVEKATPDRPADHAATTTHAGISHLVVGVFSDPANADKLISRDPLGIGSASYSKIPVKGGKTLVSAFSSDDREKVENRRRELSHINNELWVYETK